MENLKHIEIVLLNEIINRVSYSLVNTMFNDAKNKRFETLYNVKAHLGVELKEVIGQSEKIDSFINDLNKLVIIFNNEINDVSFYKRTKQQFVIMLNYRHTDSFKNLNKWILNTNNNRHTKFGLKFINLLPLKQIIKKLIGEKEYNVEDFSNFLATSGDISFFKYFLDEMRTTIAHELKHMFDDVITKGRYIADDPDSVSYYKDKNDPNIDKTEKQKKYLNLKHEIDARIQQGLRSVDQIADNDISFEEFFNEFIKYYKIPDFDELTDDNKKYVFNIVKKYFENNKTHKIRTTKKYRINENIMDQKIEIINTGIKIICEDLNVEIPKIILLTDKQFTTENKSFAAYAPSTQEIYCVIEGRNTADCLRSIAHELMHHKQNLDGRLTNEAGEDGDTFENEANSYAGIIMRRLGREIPNIFENLNENFDKRITKSSLIQENILKNKNIFIEKILGRII